MSFLAVAFLIAGLPVGYEQLRTLSIFDDVVDRNTAVANLTRLGLSAEFYAGYQLALSVILAVVCFALAAAIFLRKRDEPIALFVALMLVLLGATFPVVGSTNELEALDPFWWRLGHVLWSLSNGSVFVFFYIFPNGRFIPRWTRWLAVALAALVLISFFPDSPLYPSNWPPPASELSDLGLLLTGLFAQAYRYRRVSGPAERQQTKWVFFGFAVALLGYLGMVSSLSIFPFFYSPGSLADFLGGAAVDGFLLLIPLSISLAILRYRLWDIDILINRTLVYGALTTSVIGLYVLVVESLGTLLSMQGDLPVSLLATGLIAVLFTPLRERLQRGVNRLMYGERDDPYGVLSRLGRRLEDTLAPEAALRTIVETVAQALKLPYAAIALKQDDGQLATAVEYGTPVSDPVVLPLAYQREPVGRLILAPRAPGEPFSPSDRRLLEDLARQTGVAVHAVRLTADLQHSRERLVTTREEERRRLRRDLHDGLGPQLASLTMRAEAAHDLVPLDPVRAQEVLEGLTEQAQAAVADVRRLVYALRPPALDTLGLIGALRSQATQLGDSSLRISIEAPEELPALPAAVEVAAYRIVLEALTNVVRHAEASNCTVRLALDEEAGALDLEIEDNGRGIEEDHQAGVGLASMRERAEELGGSCTIEAVPSGSGIRVRAFLPYTRDDATEREAAQPNLKEA